MAMNFGKGLIMAVQSIRKSTRNMPVGRQTLDVRYSTYTSIKLTLCYNYCMNWCFNVYYTNLLAAELIIAQNQQLELFCEIPAAKGVLSCDTKSSQVYVLPATSYSYKHNKDLPLLNFHGTVNNGLMFSNS